ncbi:unnamed protein product [Linum trigynum]|uniref:Uncharacterized protein n=1 Tax=Linum trigynum TaxID=586398 RepID=A0AAV2EBP0_9ROSI
MLGYDDLELRADLEFDEFVDQEEEFGYRPELNELGLLRTDPRDAGISLMGLSKMRVVLGQNRSILSRSSEARQAA